MFLLIVSYIKPIEEVMKHAVTHKAWVNKYVEEGLFLFAGPKKNKQGGAILAKSIDKSRLNEILEEDSFVKEGVAEYQVIDFDCRISTPDLVLLKDM